MNVLYIIIYITAEEESEDILFIIPLPLNLKGKDFCFFAKTTVSEYISNNPCKYKWQRDLPGH